MWVNQPSRRRTCRARCPGLARGHRRARPRAGDRAQRRLGANLPTTPLAAPAVLQRATDADPGRRSTRWPTCWPAPAPRRWSWAPTPTTPTRGPPWSAGRAAAGAGLAGGVRRAGRLPAGPPAVRRAPARRPGAAARGAGRPRRRAGGRRPGVPPVPLRAGAVGRPPARRSRWSPTTPRTPTTARCSWRWSRAPPPLCASLRRAVPARSAATAPPDRAGAPPGPRTRANRCGPRT